MNTTTATRTTYTLDPAHSEIGFRVKHLGLATVKGSFNNVEATITMDPADLASLEVEATIETASIHTRNTDRDNHLRSADFFDAENHPDIVFKSKEVRNVNGNEFELAGDLTIRGTTRPVVLQAEYMGAATDPWGNEKIAFEATGAINRKEYGLTWNQALETGGVLVGEQVNFALDVQAAKG